MPDCRGDLGVTATIAIVGGGFSGLVSAFLLERSVRDPPKIVVLEGGPRFGGRIRSGSLGAGGIPYDAGAAELYDITGIPQLRRLVNLLGLSTRTMRATPTFFHRGRRLESDADFTDAFGADAVARYEAFWERGTSLRTPQEYSRAGHPQDNAHPWSGRTFRDVLRTIGDPAIEAFAAMQVHSDLAASPDRTSGTYGFDNLLIDDPRYCSMYTIVGGNERLITRLVEEVRAEKRRDAPVASVAPRRDGRFDIAVGPDEILTVDGVLLTPPPAYLLEIDYRDERLRRAIAEHVEHHDHPAAYLRVTMLFDRRFWGDDLPEDYWVSDAFDGVTVYDQSPDRSDRDAPGILSCLIGGLPAERHERRRDDDIVRDVIASLPQSLADAAERLVDARVDRWTGRLGVAALPGGQPLLPIRRRHQPSLAHPGLVLVGDYLYDATISGALDGCSNGLELLLRAIGSAETPDAADVLARAGLSDARRSDDEARVRNSALPFLRAAAESLS